MKFRSERDALAEALSTAAKAVGSRVSTPVLAGLLLTCDGNELTVVGTDLDLSVRVELEVIGVANGSAVIPARLASDVVRALEPGAVTIEAKDDQVQISAAKSSLELRCFPTVEFPQVASPAAPSATIEAEALVEGLRQVDRAASGDDARPLLTGVYFTREGGNVRLVATDSYRLAMRDLEGVSASLEGDLLVPRAALKELRSAAGSLPEGASVGISVSAAEVGFTAGSVTVTSRLLEGTYPDYRQLVPDSYPNALHAGKESLLAALRRVKLMAADQTTPVRLTLRAGGVDLAVSAPDRGEAHESVDGDFTGTDTTIAFNPSYLIDGIEAVNGDEVIIETTDGSKPATVRGSAGRDFQYLLMPVRVP